MPAVAEDGRVVPVIIESRLPMRPENYVKAVHLIVDHNPDPHLAAFHLTPAIGEVSIQTRIKMKRSTWVRAILETSTGEVWADYARVQRDAQRLRLMSARRRRADQGSRSHRQGRGDHR